MRSEEREEERMRHTVLVRLRGEVRGNGGRRRVPPEGKEWRRRQMEEGGGSGRRVFEGREGVRHLFSEERRRVVFG